MQKFKLSPAIRHWLALVAVCLGVFMALLDVTVVNVALPTIQRDFNESFNNLQWIINAYTMVYAVSLLLISKLGDLFGRKRIFQMGLLIFTLGSLASALAQSGLQLNIFRGVQGFGGAAMLSLSMAIVATTFKGKERGVALGIWSSVVGLATAIGPLFGGILVQAFSWRAIFLINVPVGIIALLMAFFFVDESYGNRNGHVDIVGIVISTVAIFCIIFGLLQKENHTSWSWLNVHVAGLLGGGLLLLVAFVILELRIKEPMMDVRMFKIPSFVGATLVGFGLGAGLYAMYTYLTVLMQNYIGYSAMQTGIRQLTISVFSLILGPVIGILTNRWGNRWLMFAGMLSISLGLYLLYRTITPNVTYENFAIAFVFLGLGNATVNPPLSAAAISAVEPKHIGMASGIVNVFRQFGISFGVVTLGIQLTNAYHDHITSHLANTGLPPQALGGIKHGLLAAGPFSGKAVLASKQAAPLRQLPAYHNVHHLVISAFDLGFKNLLLLAIGFALLGAFAAILLVRDHHSSANA
ncbi:MFS transporter [Furfurilactobacillus sp. WILCCON 0119]